MNESKIKDEQYVTIQGWMINKLQLKGNDLLVYAIIYMFSQTESQKFNGSLQYLSDWCNSTKQGIQKNLKNLINKNLIVKNEFYKNDINFCEYYTTKLYGMQLSCTNIKEYKEIIDNKLSIKKKEIIKPSLEEIKNYCLERKNNVDPKRFYDYYEANDWKDSNGKQVKSWKQKMIANWENKSSDNYKSKEAPVPEWFDKEIEPEPLTEEEKKYCEELLKEFR